VVQFIAHPDDDLLFQEPDTKQTYVWPSTSVYITGGDATNHAGPGKAFPDVCAYSASRFQGLRDAHERGVADPTWTKRAITVAGHVIEEDTLDQRPDVKLVFLRLHEAGDGHYSSGSDGFYNLYDLFYGHKSGLREWSLGSDAVDGADCDQQ